MAQTSQSHHRTANRRRLISPDLARGVTLLGIALANVGTAWVATDSAELACGYGGVYEDSLLDKVAVVLGAMFVHVRGLPMFATLLGLGVGMIVMSLWRRGYPPGSARGVIARRYGFLALFGVVHMVFVFYGDIMLFYGLAGMVMALMLTLRDRTLLWISGILLALQAIGYSALGIIAGLNPGASEMMGGNAGFGDPETYGGNLLTGLLMVVSNVFGFPLQALSYLPLIMLGFVAARRGILSDVRAHRRLLLTLVWLGVAVIVLVGLPWGLAEVGVLPVALAPVFQLANIGFGQLTGPAIIAAIALLSQPLQDRLNRETAEGRQPELSFPLRALSALGKRSMTGYVLQSVLFLVLVRPFGLGLGAEQGAFELSLIALGVWLVTVIVVVILDYADKPGPLEYVHRYLSYGRQGLQARWVPKELRNRQADTPLSHTLPTQEPAGRGGEVAPEEAGQNRGAGYPDSQLPPEQPGTAPDEHAAEAQSNPYRQSGRGLGRGSGGYPHRAGPR